MSIPLGNAIKAARLRQKMKQWEVAQSLGVTRAAVGQWEAGTNEPTSLNLRKLSSLLQLDLINATPDRIVDENITYYKIADDHNVLVPSGVFDFPITLHAGGENGQVFWFNDGDPYFYVRRFEFFSEIPGIRAMVFSTDVLSPKYEQNDVVYVDPNKKPQAGSYAVFLCKDGTVPGMRNYRIVRRVLFIDETRVIFARLNPYVQEEWTLDSFTEIGTIMREYELVRKRGK